MFNESGNEGKEHSRCIDDSTANHIEHISMIVLWVHIPTAA